MILPSHNVLNDVDKPILYSRPPRIHVDTWSINVGIISEDICHMWWMEAIKGPSCVSSKMNHKDIFWNSWSPMVFLGLFTSFYNTCRDSTKHGSQSLYHEQHLWQMTVDPTWEWGLCLGYQWGSGSMVRWLRHKRHHLLVSPIMEMLRSYENKCWWLTGPTWKWAALKLAADNRSR